MAESDPATHEKFKTSFHASKLTASSTEPQLWPSVEHGKRASLPLQHPERRHRGTLHTLIAVMRRRRLCKVSLPELSPRLALQQLLMLKTRIVGLQTFIAHTEDKQVPRNGVGGAVASVESHLAATLFQ